MSKRQPGLFDTFKGLWARGPIDNTPQDHFSDCLNTIYASAGVGTRDGLSSYSGIANIRRMSLYKPNPPFTGTNVPRIIALNNAGELYDILLSTVVPIYTNVLMTDFGAVNFFGRIYITPSDGKVGLEDDFVKMYDGTTLRNAGGLAPTTVMTAAEIATAGTWDVGTWLVSYAFETSSGFITQPRVPFVGFETFGGFAVEFGVPLGPLGTAARWIIMTKSFPLASIGPLGGPWEVSRALISPLFFAVRIPDNISTTYQIATMYDEQLINSADYLLTQLTTIPAGVGLLDYKGRMVSYGEYDDPSLVRVSAIGEPEAYSATSGFLITDPSDNTGVRSAVEFRNTLYLFKQSRGYMTEDNTLEASTWPVINFEKAVGTEQNGIADILDAKGASSDGFIIASLGALYYFNGTVVDPELSYKIRDLWLRRNEEYFYLTQVSHDPINKRIYILIALDSAVAVSHLIFGDYRDGLNPFAIKWSLWEFNADPTSMLIYTDFTNNTPSLVTRIAQSSGIKTVNINTPSSDDGVAVDSFFQLAPLRFSYGLSQYERIRINGNGPGTLVFTAFSKDLVTSVTPIAVTIPLTPGREYISKFNLVSEECILKIRCAVLDEKYQVNSLKIDGQNYGDERPG